MSRLDDLAAYWQGYALSMAKAPPPLYSQEDWKAEALLGLAKALSTMDLDAPLPRQEAYIRVSVGHHLAKARRDVNLPTASGGPPRVTFTTAKRLDEPHETEYGDLCDLYDITPSPASPDMTQEAHASALLALVGRLARAMPPADRQAVGFLLRGLTPAEIGGLPGHTEASARTRRTRVRAKLREGLTKEGYAT